MVPDRMDPEDQWESAGLQRIKPLRGDMETMGMDDITHEAREKCKGQSLGVFTSGGDSQG